MKTTSYLITSILLTGMLVTADVQAQPGRPGARGRSGHPVHVAPSPRPHYRTHIFTPIVGRPYVIPHTFVVPRPRPIIVPAPAPVILPSPTVTIWITNPNGSRSPVILRIDGPWYIGPRGERYASMPSEDQLRLVYGLDCGPMEPEQVSVYITTDSGALRRVTLIRTAGGFRGPNGELYSQMPTNDQLRMAYGR